MDRVSSHRPRPAWSRALVIVCFCLSPCASLRTGVLSALQTGHSPPPPCSGGAEAAITVTGLRGASIQPLTNHKTAPIIPNDSTTFLTEGGVGTCHLWGSPPWSNPAWWLDLTSPSGVWPKRCGKSTGLGHDAGKVTQVLEPSCPHSGRSSRAVH